ncbi:unnamed protein product [Urochloa humidicola]
MLKFKEHDYIMWKKEAATWDKDNGNGKDISITVRNQYPRHPAPSFHLTEGFDWSEVEEYMQQRYASIARSIANDIIIPDPTPRKIFLDTTRLLAEKTNNLLEEVWNFIENGKLIQSAVLLLAAHEQIRGGSSSNVNGSSKKDGFGIISKCITRLSFALKCEKGSNGMAQKLLEERRALTDCAWALVDVISRAGEPLSAYIQAHSEVPRMEVLEHVSCILREYGLSPTEEVMNTINLQPYDCKMSDKESCSNDANIMETTILHAAEGKAARVGGGWDPTYTRRSFFPYWRSVLRTRCPVKVYPAYARADVSNHKLGSRSSPMINGSTPTPNHKLGSVGRISPLPSNHQPKRSFSTAAVGVFRLLKVLKHA